MSLLSRIAAMFLLIAPAASAVAGEPKVISEKRLLANGDHGRVFIAEGLTPHPNFRKVQGLAIDRNQGAVCL